MSNTATDLTEEDAADLQFPKDFFSDETFYFPETCENESSCDSDVINGFCEVCLQKNSECSCYKCSNCRKSLSVPFIECVECENVLICRECYAKGSNFGVHQSDHRYKVCNHDFILFENSDWSAEEELILLDILSMYGYGNWELVADKLKRTKSEVKEHYDYFYLDKPVSELPKVKETELSVLMRPIIPYRFRLKGLEEPPRHEPGTLAYDSTAGYNAARADFEVEYDRNAEQLLSKLSSIDLDEFDPRYKVLCELQCAIVLSYNHRLFERFRRKKIIRNHGLILSRKTLSLLHRYDLTLTRKMAERFVSFMQFYKGIEFEKVMEGLHRAAELRQRISRLSEYRKLGITTLQGAKTYEKIKRKENEYNQNLNLFQSNAIFNWRPLNGPPRIITSTTPRRGSYRPLDIVGLPGFEKLTQKEQELCSNVRLVPEAYTEFKHILVMQNKRMGSVKLQTARKLLKIDVNKTRKLYDFLVEQGFIVKPIDK